MPSHATCPLFRNSDHNQVHITILEPSCLAQSLSLNSHLHIIKALVHYLPAWHNPFHSIHTSIIIIALVNYLPGMIMTLRHVTLRRWHPQLACLEYNVLDWCKNCARKQFQRLDKENGTCSLSTIQCKSQLTSEEDNIPIKSILKEDNIRGWFQNGWSLGVLWRFLDLYTNCLWLPSLVNRDYSYNIIILEFSDQRTHYPERNFSRSERTAALQHDEVPLYVLSKWKRFTPCSFSQAQQNHVHIQCLPP